MANPKSVQEIIDLWKYVTTLSATTDARFADLTKKLADTKTELTNFINTRVDAAIKKAADELNAADTRLTGRINQILPQVTSGAVNLNSMLTPGRYLVRSASAVAYTYPQTTDQWWWLDVRKTPDSAFVLQEVIAQYNPRDRYSRSTNNSGAAWTDWTLSYAEYMG